MNEIAKIRAEHQVADALRQRNGPSTADIHDLPLLSPVLVWRKDTGQSGHWTGPYTLLSMEGETCKVQLPHGPTDFRSTVVKPYLVEPPADSQTNPRTDLRDENIATNAEPLHEQPQESLQEQPQEPLRKRPQRAHRLPARFQQNIADISVYLTDNLTPFTESRRKEIKRLLERGVFTIVNEADIPQDIRIFNSRFVDEIRNSGTNEAYEKSRLVVQAYDDQNKNMILTQSPTIQRVSQRIILAMAATLMNTRNLALYSRDITQAYVQSLTTLNRDFFIRPPPELNLQPGSILRVLKPLYGIPEAGNHWFKTYHQYHTDNLRLTQSTFDPCLLFTDSPVGFAIVGLQTDDTLFLADTKFATHEEKELQKIKFMAKKREKLTHLSPLSPNGGKIKLELDNAITLTQDVKRQVLLALFTWGLSHWYCS